MTCKCKTDFFKNIGFELINGREDERDIEVLIERVSNGTKHDIALAIDNPDCNSVTIPIKYCPFCGRKF